MSKNEALEAEVVQQEIMALKQEPIIIYDAVKAKGKEIEERIASLNIETMEPTEDNLRVIKSTRTELKKEFDFYEQKRKMIKDLVMKPYQDFEAVYKEFIASKFKNADALLKEKIRVVEDGILAQKIEKLKAYFNEINTFDFIKFEDLELHIIKSKSDKHYKEQIEEYLLNVQSDLNTIDTLENKERILAKYQIYKDLNRAISEVNLEIEREKAIQQKAMQQAKVEPVAEPKPQEPMQQEAQTEQKAESQEVKQYVAKFKVKATIEQIKALKAFMQQNNIEFEAIK